MSFPIVYPVNRATMWQVADTLPPKVERAIIHTNPKPYKIGGRIVLIAAAVIAVTQAFVFAFFTQDGNLLFVIGLAVFVLGLMIGYGLMGLPDRRNELRRNLAFDGKPGLMLSDAHPVFQAIMSPELIEWLSVQRSEDVRSALMIYYTEAMVVYKEYRKHEYDELSFTQSIQLVFKCDNELLRVAMSCEPELRQHFDTTDLKKFWIEREKQLKATLIVRLQQLESSSLRELDEATKALGATNS